MTIVVTVSLAMVSFATVAAVYRIVTGPTDGDRANATELVFFGFIAFAAVLGIYIGFEALFDILLVATVFGFLSAMSLARVIKDGKR